VLQPLVILLFLVGIVMAKLQSDLGSGAVIISMIGLMAYAVGVPLKRIVMIGRLVVVFSYFAISSTPYPPGKTGDISASRKAIAKAAATKLARHLFLLVPAEYLAKVWVIASKLMVILLKLQTILFLRLWQKNSALSAR
jgi:cell division protein FtsW (lipid II flippase)